MREGTETGKEEILIRTPGQIRVLFAVEDSGIGIKEEDKEKVFASFEQVYSESTRQYDGTGLGIGICQRLLHLMNSSLQMKTEFIKGSYSLFLYNLKKL